MASDSGSGLARMVELSHEGLKRKWPLSRTGTCSRCGQERGKSFGSRPVGEVEGVVLIGSSRVMC